MRIGTDALPAEEHEAALYISRNLDALATIVLEFEDTLELYRTSFAQREVTLSHRAALERPKLPDGLSQADRQSAAAMRQTVALHREAQRAMFVQNKTVQDAADRFGRWEMMAVRNGAIVANSFWMAMQAINSLVGKTTVIKSKIDTAARKRGTKTFLAAFPEIAAMRKRAAHPHEFEAKPEELSRHEVTDFIDTKALSIGSGSKTFIGSYTERSALCCVWYATFEDKLHSYELSEATLKALKMSAEEYHAAFSLMENAQDIRLRQALKRAMSER